MVDNAGVVRTLGRVGDLLELEELEVEFARHARASRHVGAQAG